jgi:hypothetical protein
MVLDLFARRWISVGYSSLVLDYSDHYSKHGTPQPLILARLFRGILESLRPNMLNVVHLCCGKAMRRPNVFFRILT